MEARNAIMKLIPTTDTSIKSRSTPSRVRNTSSIPRGDNMIEEDDEDLESLDKVGEMSTVDVVPLPSALMGLPEGLTKRDLCLSIHANQHLHHVSHACALVAVYIYARFYEIQTNCDAGHGAIHVVDFER